MRRGGKGRLEYIGEGSEGRAGREGEGKGDGEKANV